MMSPPFWHIFYIRAFNRYLCYSKYPDSNPKLKPYPPKDFAAAAPLKGLPRSRIYPACFKKCKIAG